MEAALPAIIGYIAVTLMIGFLVEKEFKKCAHRILICAYFFDYFEIMSIIKIRYIEEYCAFDILQSRYIDGYSKSS